MIVKLIIYVSLLLVMSATAFVMYGKDKRRAFDSEDRIQEKTLLILAACGGALGSFLGRLAFHHKTNKSYFSIVIVLSLIFQLGVLALGIALTVIE